MRDFLHMLPLPRFTDEARARRGGGLSESEADALVDFQVAMMRAIGRNEPPPMPPADLDFAKLEAMGDDDLQLLLTPAGARVTVVPVAVEAAETLPDDVGEALATLMGDHQALVELGSGFGGFDVDGRAMYLDRVGDVQARWREWLGAHGPRLKSASLLANEYLDQTDAFLKGVGIESIEEYADVLDGAHRRMREAP